MTKARWLLIGVLATGLLAACSKEPPATPPAAAPAVAVQHFSPDSVARGAVLFAERCAQCHGPQGQGHPDWQTPSNGQFAAAPPLNGTGNDWKRTRAELAAVIRHGVRRKSDNAEIMPMWQGRLDERDIEDVINWMQSLWPAEVYEAWTRTHPVAATPKS
jgi:mono/diheme cytochrome c family protein